MTIADARALALDINERIKSIGSSETQNADVGRLANAGAVISDLCNQLADPALAKVAYDTEQARVKAEADAAKKNEADAKKAAEPAPTQPSPEPNRQANKPEPIELSIDRDRMKSGKK